MAEWYDCVVDSKTTSCKVYYTSKNYCSKLADSIPLDPAMRDRISELPDDIVSHILVFLSLRDGIRLTTLSQRWRNIGSSLTQLDLDSRAMRGDANCTMNKVGRQKLYVKSVKQVLQRQQNLYILSFRISCCLHLKYAKRVHRWLNFAATSNGLESLKLQFSATLAGFGCKNHRAEQIHTISSSFLSQFPRLKNLHLETCGLKLRSDFRFNKLKTLELCYVVLDGTEWGSLVCCPTIESLRFKLCNLPEKLSIRDNLEHLSLLSISECPTLRKIELNASNLNTFELHGDVGVECCLLARTELENVSVYLGENVPAYLRKKDNGGVCTLTGLARVKNLILRVEIHKLQLPTCPSDLFRSVLCLQLDLSLDSFNHDMRQILLHHFLIWFPTLRKLEMTIPDYNWTNYHHKKSYELPTSYLHSNLMVVELINFKVSWMEFAEFLLRSAIVLDRMVITKTNLKRQAESFTTKERLLIESALYGKALSPQAQVVFSDR